MRDHLGSELSSGCNTLALVVGYRGRPRSFRLAAAKVAGTPQQAMVEIGPSLAPGDYAGNHGVGLLCHHHARRPRTACHA